MRSGGWPATGLSAKETALPRQADHFHRQPVLDALVEQLFAVRHPDLRPLVADDGSVQPKPPRPWQRAGKRPPGARDDGDPCLNDPAHGLHVSRIELEPGIEDRAVEVYSEEAISISWAHPYRRYARPAPAIS